MKTRILTAIIALAAFIGILLLPPIVFTIALAAVTCVMLYECYHATKADIAMKVVGFISAIMMMLAMYNALNERGAYMILVYIAITLVLILYMILIIAKHGKRSYKDIMSNGFLTLYITVFMGCILLSREFLGTSRMLLIFVCAWSTDTFAYFFGMLFGKHKLIPHVSPKKTVEGAIGGVIGAIVSCIVYLCFVLVFIDGVSVDNKISFILPVALKGLIIGGAGGIFSQLGDLVASSVKRDEDIKDFGWIFPGHGGFMDRFDSVIFIAPIILWLMTFVSI